MDLMQKSFRAQSLYEFLEPLPLNYYKHLYLLATEVSPIRLPVK